MSPLVGIREHADVEYYRGVLDGLYPFAWWKNGVLYVGTTGTTLKEAQAMVRATAREAGVEL